MGKTVKALEALRAELVERRRQEAYAIGGAYHNDRIMNAIQMHLAIEVLDAVIAEGKDEAEFDASAAIR
jgi:hypothetical protein